MRMLMQVVFPIEPFNSYVLDGTIGEKIKKVLEAIKPEAIYFSEQQGHRGCVAVVQVNSASDIPKLAEPFFLLFEAEVEFRIAMTPEDLAGSGIDSIGKQWS